MAMTSTTSAVEDGTGRPVEDGMEKAAGTEKGAGLEMAGGASAARRA